MGKLKTQTTDQKWHKTYPFFLPWIGDNLLHDSAIDGGERGAHVGGLRRRQVPGDGEPIQLTARHRGGLPLALSGRSHLGGWCSYFARVGRLLALPQLSTSGHCLGGGVVLGCM